MDGRLAGRTALLTGVTSGIGRAIAQRFAAEGAFVAVGRRDERRGAEVVAAVSAAGGRAVLLPCDLDGTEATSGGVAARASDVLGGRVDVLVDNAAAVPIGATVATDEAALDAAWAVSVKGPPLLVKALAPAMTQRGYGAVVSISSWMARAGTGVVGVYAAPDRSPAEPPGQHHPRVPGLHDHHRRTCSRLRTPIADRHRGHDFWDATTGGPAAMLLGLRRPSHFLGRVLWIFAGGDSMARCQAGAS